MMLKLLDYRGRVTEEDIGDLENIARITIDVITGDEIATVIRKDYTETHYDSSNCRMDDYCDHSYEVYDFKKKENLLTDPMWQNRKSSYWFWGE